MGCGPLCRATVRGRSSPARCLSFRTDRIVDGVRLAHKADFRTPGRAHRDSPPGPPRRKHRHRFAPTRSAICCKAIGREGAASGSGVNSQWDSGFEPVYRGAATGHVTNTHGLLGDSAPGMSGVYGHVRGRSVGARQGSRLMPEWRYGAYMRNVFTGSMAESMHYGPELALVRAFAGGRIRPRLFSCATVRDVLIRVRVAAGAAARGTSSGRRAQRPTASYTLSAILRGSSAMFVPIRFMTYPMAIPASGSARPQEPPKPSCP